MTSTLRRGWWRDEQPADTGGDSGAGVIQCNSIILDWKDLTPAERDALLAELGAGSAARR